MRTVFWPPASDETRNAAKSGPDAVRSLYTRIQPMIPAQIENGIAALSPDEKATLGAICRYVIMQTAPAEVPGTLGLPPEAIEQTLTKLGL